MGERKAKRAEQDWITLGVRELNRAWVECRFERVGKPQPREYGRCKLEQLGPGRQVLEQPNIELASDLVGDDMHLFLDAGFKPTELGHHLVGGFEVVDQHATAHLVAAPEHDNACADAIPRFHHCGCLTLGDKHRATAADQIARHERVPRLDVAHFIEAHDRGADRLHVRLGWRSLLVAAALQVVVDHIAPASQVARQKILESATPQGHGRRGSEDIAQLIGFELRIAACNKKVPLQNLLERFTPLVSAEELHQSGERCCTGHGWKLRV